MKTLILTVIFSVHMSTWAFSELPDKATLLNRADQTTFRLASPIDNFAVNAYRTLAHGQLRNIVFSPFSIHAVMSMLYYGSPESSRTFQQISKALSLGSNGTITTVPSDAVLRDYLYNYLSLFTKYKNDPFIDVFNRMYVDTSVSTKANFQNALSLFYGSIAESVDMVRNGGRVADYINEFVANVTSGNIQNLLSPDSIDEMTRLILINAVRFKGEWKYQFNTSLTRSDIPFQSSRGRTTFPAMMRITANFWVSHNDPALGGGLALELPFKGERYSMLIFLPRRGQRLSQMESLIQGKSKSLFDFAFMRSRLTQVKLIMPKFSITYSKDLVEMFRRMGVIDVFNPDSADLSDIADNYRDLHVNSIIHKAKIEVNEEGAEASAATGVVIGTRSSNAVSKTVSIKVDRPFMFAIVDRDYNIPLFMGKIEELPSTNRGTNNNPIHGQFNPNSGQFNPNHGQSNSNNGQFNPNHGQFNPNHGQSNSNNGQFNTNNGQFNPSNGQFNPNNGQFNPNNGQFNPNNGQSNPARGQSTPNRGQSNPTRGQSNPNQGQSNPNHGQSNSERSGSSVFQPQQSTNGQEISFPSSFS